MISRFIIYTQALFQTLMWHFYFSTTPKILLYAAVPTASPYLMSNNEYLSNDSVTHLIALLWYLCLHPSNSCFCPRTLYSFPSILRFPRLVFLGLLVDFSILQWSLGGYKYWIGRSMCDVGVVSRTLRVTSSLTSYNFSTILMPHFPLFFFSPVIKITSSISIFIYFNFNSSLHYASYCFFLDVIAKTLFSTFSMLPLYTCWNNVGVFLFLDYLHLVALLESLLS